MIKNVQNNDPNRSHNTCYGIHGCQDVVKIWQDLAKTAKMLVRVSTRVDINDRIAQQLFSSEKIFYCVSYQAHCKKDWSASSWLSIVNIFVLFCQFYLHFPNKVRSFNTIQTNASSRITNSISSLLQWFL